jgi:maltose O-acetyltransferase
MRSEEKQKMLRGELYLASDSVLAEERQRARRLLHRMNVEMPGGTPGSYAVVVRELLPNAKPPTWIQAPFYCDYGYNIHLGEDVYFNFNGVVLDGAVVTIGARTQFGPNVQLYTASHTLEAEPRRRALELAKPITIGRDCWFGGSAVVCPGVTIGDRCVIGAGAVVTRDIPDDSFAAGSPARVIRSIDQ